MSGCRDAANEAERHMLFVWWLRVVAMATGWDEDAVALLGNVMVRMKRHVGELEAAASWVEWLPESWKAEKL